MVTAARGIDRSSYEPAYMQLVGILRESIASGRYLAGDQLPTEAELCASYDVSPMTVRRAIGVLLDQGAVRTHRGRGTFVQPLRLSTASFDLSPLRDILDDEAVTAKVIEARVVPAAGRAAARLALAVGTRIVSIRRVLQRGGEPLFYHRESLVYDPTRPIVEAELDVTALRGLFEGGAGVGPKHGELILHASVLTKEEARYLASEPGHAAFVLEHLFYDYDDVPVSWGHFACRGELLQFHASVGVDTPTPKRKRRS